MWYPGTTDGRTRWTQWTGLTSTDGRDTFSRVDSVVSQPGEDPEAHEGLERCE